MKHVPTWRQFGLMTMALAIALLSGLFASKARAADSLTVDLRDLSGRVVGTAMMTEMAGGMMEVKVQVEGMEPVAGDHLFAVTTKGVCMGDFSSAGDIKMTLPNVQFYRDGSADSKAMVEGNLASLMDSDGSAVVLYADTSMDSDRIVCGVAAQPGTMPPAPTQPAPAPTQPAPAPTQPAPAPTTTPVEPVQTLEEYIAGGAAAEMRDVNGRIVGWAWMFTDTDYNETSTWFWLQEMDRVPGDHMLAITSSGRCAAPDYSSAGDSIFTYSNNVQMFASGNANFFNVEDSASLNTSNLFDADGSAIVMYADKAPDAGDRIVCGTLIPFPAYLAEAGMTVDDFIALVWGN